MAVATIVSSSLRLELYAGEDPETGNPIFTSKSFNNVKTDVTPDQLWPIATAVAGLQEFPLQNVERRDYSELSEA